MAPISVLPLLVLIPMMILVADAMRAPPEALMVEPQPEAHTLQHASALDAAGAVLAPLEIDSLLPNREFANLVNEQADAAATMTPRDEGEEPQPVPITLAELASFGLRGSNAAEDRSTNMNADTTDTGPLIYHNNGPIVQVPKIYLIFVGSYWSTTTGSSYLQYISYFVRDIIQSAKYFEPLYQYQNSACNSNNVCTSTGYTISTGSWKNSYTLASTATAVTDSAIQSALLSYVSSGSLPASDANSVYGWFFAPGVTITQSNGDQSCTKFCGYHGSFTSSSTPYRYFVMPYLGSGSCSSCGGGTGGSGAIYGSTTLSLTPPRNYEPVVSHELAEWITDPGLGTWFSAGGNEIADLCTYDSSNRALVRPITVPSPPGQTATTYTYYVSQEFSNWYYKSGGVTVVSWSNKCY